MRISHAKYQIYINELNSYLKNKDLFAPILLNNETFLFPIVNDRKSLVISLNHNTPLVYVSDDERFYSSFENPFYLRFKKLLGQSNVKSISLCKNDSIVEIELCNFDNLNCEQNIKITIELIPKKPNLVVCNENNEILEIYYKDKIRNLSHNNLYVYPKQNLEPSGTVLVTIDFLKNHFEHELEVRREEKYKDFLNFVNGKIKLISRKINAITNDVETAKNNLKYCNIADEILCLNLNLKDHRESIDTSYGLIHLDKSKTILENVEHFYKRAKKAKETISRSSTNIENAKNEITEFKNILNKFKESNEKEADKLMDEIGMRKKKKEVKETAFNRPYKINYNGTIIYFGRNASQNDYLSFVMKLNREFIWLHIKDKSGAHLIIANSKPTEKELKVAAEISLICSRATSGEVIYAIKKNVRRGHVLGEAILKNYSLIKLNDVSKETKELFSKAERIK